MEVFQSEFDQRSTYNPKDIIVFCKLPKCQHLIFPKSIWFLKVLVKESFFNTCWHNFNLFPTFMLQKPN